MAIVEFDKAEFRSRYPQLAALTDEQLQNAFEVAELFVDNTERSRIPYDPDRGVNIRKTLLYLLTCHLLTLATRGVITGALASATEGSVSASFSVPAVSNNAAWFIQTPCGMTFWQLWQRYALGGRYVRYCHH